MNKTLSDYAENCKTNCKLSSTVVFDNSDNQVSLEYIYPTTEQAEQALTKAIKLAHTIENDPCQIIHHIQQTDEGVMLFTTFSFSCQAEAVIFQMKLRQ